MFFLDKLFDSYKNRRTTESKQAALDAAIDLLPESITSPIWRIKGNSTPSACGLYRRLTLLHDEGWTRIKILRSKFCMSCYLAS